MKSKKMMQMMKRTPSKKKKRKRKKKTKFLNSRTKIMATSFTRNAEEKTLKAKMLKHRLIEVITRKSSNA